MRTSLLLILFGISVSMPSYAQILAEGKVLNLYDEQPLSFVNIGIINSAVGTISDSDGNFSLIIPESYLKDSVIFSQLGFEKLFVAVSDFSRQATQNTIYLKESPANLKAVTVIGDQLKRRKYKFGNYDFEGSGIYADTVTAGSAMALLIKNNLEYPVFVRQAQLIIVNNTFGKFKVRTRIYALDATTGLPGEDMLNESVVTWSNLENGRLKVDLSKYNIEVKGDFFLAFEWILDKNDRNHLFDQYDGFLKDNRDKVRVDYSYIEGKKVPYINYLGNLNVGPTFGISVSRKSLEKHVCYYRLNSFGKWFRSTSILAADIILSNAPFIETTSNSVPPTSNYHGPVDLLPYFKMEFLTTQIPAVDTARGLEEGHTRYFEERFVEPVVIEVRKTNNQLTFHSKNKSFYPYKVEMNFSQVRNLRPMVSNECFSVNPGNTRLLELNVVDPSWDNYHYQLSVKSMIGGLKNTPLKKYPYLIPIGDHRKTKLKSSQSKGTNSPCSDIFYLSRIDTVFAMRKGVVAATPTMKMQVDRIFKKETLEIRHADGTVMVYKNMNPTKVFVEAGDTVFPGQALAIIDSTQMLELELYQISGNDSIDQINISYLVSEENICLYQLIPDDTLVSYPDHIVMKEMTKQERKNHNRNP